MYVIDKVFHGKQRKENSSVFLQLQPGCKEEKSLAVSNTKSILAQNLKASIRKLKNEKQFHPKHASQSTKARLWKKDFFQKNPLPRSWAMDLVIWGLFTGAAIKISKTWGPFESQSGHILFKWVYRSLAHRLLLKKAATIKSKGPSGNCYIYIFFFSYLHSKGDLT